MKVIIVNKSQHELPQYSTVQAAGIDIRTNLDHRVILKPLERRLIPTGLFIKPPVGTEAQIRSKSGLAIRKGISVLNAPATIDTDFQGEIMVILVNISAEEVSIENDDRICQMVISKHERIHWEEIRELNDS